MNEPKLIPPLELAEILRGGQQNGDHAEGPATSARRLVSQPWRTFASETPAVIDWLVPGLIPMGSFVFVASPPKKGKTWTILDLGLSIVLGAKFLAYFQVDDPRPVLLVLLEGNRAALRDRIGALARGRGIDPDGHELDALHVAYKPRGINLADPGWAADLCAEAADLNAACVCVDVLRAAARLKSENDPRDFLDLRDNLTPAPSRPRPHRSSSRRTARANRRPRRVRRTRRSRSCSPATARHALSGSRSRPPSWPPAAPTPSGCRAGRRRTAGSSLRPATSRTAEHARSASRRPAHVGRLGCEG